ncbi:amidase domain-containing protein [Nonomuraea sp. NPDC059194]|uniref:amidase domain-containing protein n=1 Tax=Nonomuraea sp. NPDC059194 TaxID=3346764 RepID=UPI0036A3C6C6
MKRIGVLLSLTALGAALSGAIPASASTTADADVLAIAQSYLTDRATRLTVDIPPNSRRALTTVPTSIALQEHLADDAAAIDQRRQLLRSVNGGHVRADVSVSDVSHSTQGNLSTLSLTEHTKLYFARPLTDGPAAERYRLRHRFTFEKTGDGWVLTQSTPELSTNGLPPDTYPRAFTARTVTASPPGEPSVTARPKSIQRPDKLSRGYRSSNSVNMAYDYQAMVDYAYRYAENYNPNYRTYGGVGGDCTNFLSQIVKAGGWQGTGAWPGEDRTSPAEWFYGDATWTTTYTWAAAHNWFQFARTWSGRVSGLSNVWQMGIADVLQIDSDSDGNISHSMVVTDIGVDGSGVDELFMTYHSSDTVDKPLSSVLAGYGASATFYAHRT